MRFARHAVRIVASRASRLRGDDMLVVAGKTLVGQNTSAVVAFVAKRVVGVVLNAKIRLRQLTFEQRRIRRAVRTFRPAAARARSLIAIVAIGAIHEARNRLRREQARHIGIFASGFHWMK